MRWFNKHDMVLAEQLERWQTDQWLGVLADQQTLCASDQCFWATSAMARRKPPVAGDESVPWRCAAVNIEPLKTLRRKLGPCKYCYSALISAWSQSPEAGAFCFLFLDLPAINCNIVKSCHMTYDQWILVSAIGQRWNTKMEPLIDGMRRIEKKGMVINCDTHW